MQWWGEIVSPLSSCDGGSVLTAIRTMGILVSAELLLLIQMQEINQLNKEKIHNFGSTILKVQSSAASTAFKALVVRKTEEVWLRRVAPP